MTRDSKAIENHNFLMEFLQGTEHDDSALTDFIKAVLAQYVDFLRNNMMKIADETGHIKFSDLVDVQVAGLRGCVVDLLKYKDLINDKFKECMQ